MVNKPKFLNMKVAFLIGNMKYLRKVLLLSLNRKAAKIGITLLWQKNIRMVLIFNG